MKCAAVVLALPRLVLFIGLLAEMRGPLAAVLTVARARWLADWLLLARQAVIPTSSPRLPADRTGACALELTPINGGFGRGPLSARRLDARTADNE